MQIKPTLKPKAIALISGGLDSMLAAKVVLDQGVDVEGVNFFTGFCVEGHTHAVRKKQRSKRKRNNALWVADQLNIKLHIVDIVDEYKEVVLNPKYGYGKNLNPCMDCKVFMVREALELKAFDDSKFDFVITGEVIGQRPKSQRKDTMPVIAKDSGAEDRLLRPLCAQLLPPTVAERNNWVDRSLLHGFSGRNRKPQMALAEKFGFKDYAQPAGGCCFLTDASYSGKLQDLWTSRSERSYELDDIMLLKIGRHLRPRPEFKVIIGREEGENRFLEGYRKQFTHLRTVSHEGPLALIDGAVDDDGLLLSARIVSRYSQGRLADRVRVSVTKLDGVSEDIEVIPYAAHEIPQHWHVGTEVA